MAQDEVLAKAIAYRKARILRSQANRGRLQSEASASKTSLEPSGGYSKVGQILADASKYSPQPEQKEDSNFWLDTLHNVAHTPVIKQIIDTISTPLYMAANYADYSTATDEHNANKLRNSMESGDKISTALDYLGMAGGPSGAMAAGMAKGLSGGIGANKNDDNTFANTVKNLQTRGGIDTESPESKAVQGWGGFALDVALDPINVIPLAPGVKLAGGAMKGSREFKAAQRANRKTGVDMPDNMAKTRWDNAKQEAKSNLFDYRVQQYKQQEGRKATKAFKKEARRIKRSGSDTQSVRYIIENLHTLREAVGKKQADDLIEKHLDQDVRDVPTPTPDVPTNVPANNARFTAGPEGTVDNTIPTEVPTAAIPEELIPEAGVANADVRLSNFKEPTKDEKLFDLIGMFKSVGSKRKYDDTTVQRVNDLITAKTVNPTPVANDAANAVDELAGKEVPDVEGTVREILEFDKAMGGGTVFPVPSITGKGKVSVPLDDFIFALRDKSDPKVWQMHWDIAKKNGLAATTKVAPKKAANAAPGMTAAIAGHTRITDKELAEFGVDPAHFKDIRKGKRIEEIFEDMPDAEVSALTKDIRDKKFTPAQLKPFYELLDTTKPKDLADMIDSLAATDAFKATAKEMSEHGSKRAGIPDPAKGVSGSAKLAQPSNVVNADDILASKTAAAPEQSRAYLEAVTTETARAMLQHTRGAELRVMADDLLKETIDKQRQPAGPLRAKGGASVKEDLSAAKYETKHNTHSAIHRMKAIAGKLREKGFRDGKEYDEAYMLVLKDIDNRLRLAGFDPHLSNMALTTDDLVVRLAPSDVLGLMTQSDRVKFIHGAKNANRGSVYREFLPTTVLDMAEVLVRSATRLKPDGSVDMEALVTNAIDTLLGKYQLGKGARVIKNNLDGRTWAKNHEMILHQMDLDNAKAGKPTNYKDQFLKSSDDVEKRLNVVQAAKEAHPELYTEIFKKRTDKATYELLKVFTQNKFTPNTALEKTSRINDLISINMRNASVMGGNVAKPINEAAADFSAKVLDALDNGTAGDFISALVSKPSLNVTDKVARQINADNARQIRESVATPEEIRHITATNRNVTAGVKQGARSDAEIGKIMLKEKMLRARGGAISSHLRAGDRETIQARQRAAKNNKDAYQKDRDLEAENTKPLKTQDKEAQFDLAQREINKDVIWRAFGPRRYVDRKLGMGKSYDEITGSLHATPLIMTAFHGILRELRAKGYSKVQLHTAFQTLKQGAPNDPISSELNAVLDKIFDPSQNNFLTRNSIGPDHFNKVLASVGFDPAKIFVPANLTPQEMRNVWKHWDVDDVEDFFSKMMGAMTKTANEVAMGASFSKHFGEAVAKPGYVKLVDKSGKNPFYELIDKDLYYPKDIAYEMVHIGRMLEESRSFKPKDPLYKFVTQIMDPTVSLLKMTQTTMKPGHHVMSLQGDLWRNHMALATIGVFNPAKQIGLIAESYRILKSNVGPIEELSEFDKFTRAQRITKNIRVGTDENGVMHVDKKGEVFPNIKGGGQISHEDLYAISQAEGVATPAYLGGGGMEDMLAETGGFAERGTNMAAKTVDMASRGMDKLANDLIPVGKGKKFSLNKFTANRDALMRQALFLGAMRSRKFDSLEEAVRFSSSFVRKWAPTAADLAAGEAKYARRMFFYYTWLRGMVPRIIESALMTPGVALIPNKAMYNLGVANGVDLNSIGDPFPDDQLFPKWYTEKVLGPSYRSHDGDLWGFNPTGPLGDVLNSLGSGVTPKDFIGMDAAGKVAKTFANMSTPWFKAPAETFVLNETFTGVPIEDDLEYYQDMIGPVRTASRATGKDFYLGITDQGVGIPNRTEKKFEYGMTPEETFQNALPELLNYFTGSQFTNYTSDSAENSAYYQDKQKQENEWKMRERLGQW